MFKSLFSIGILCLFSTLQIFGQAENDTIIIQKLDEVVVTDTKFKISRENSGKVISFISAEDLEHLKGTSVATVLNSLAGIEINGARSNDGQNLNYYIRGGRNRQVLILIDGVQLTDPSQIANDYDLRLLQTEQIKSIEVLKGAASTLYGSGAATAVINIKLKDSAEKPFAVNFSSVIGSNNTKDDKGYDANSFRNSGMISGRIKKFNYKLGVANTYSEGMSAVASGLEDDSYNSVHSNIQFGYDLNDNIKLKAFFNNDRFKAQFDDGFTLTDADNLSISKQNRVGLNSELNYKNGSVILNTAYNTVDREIESNFPSKFNGKSFVLDAYDRHSFKEKFFMTAGINIIHNRMESFSLPFGSNGFQQDINEDTAEFSIVDPYANLLFVSDVGFNVNAGLRLNNHSEYGSHLVYSLNPSYRIKFKKSQLKILASYSTAYITPSLFQLFEPTFGNIALQPEENRTIEAGLVFSNEDLELGLVYFNRKEENFIDFIDLGEFTFQYKNIEDEFTASGIEVNGRYKISKALNFNTNFTYTKVEEDLQLRIPEVKANASLAYSISERFLTRFDYQYNDERNDQFFDAMTFESQSVTLDSYSIVNLFFNYQLKKDKVNLFANVFNLLNSDYEELFGYSTKGRNVSLGLNISI